MRRLAAIVVMAALVAACGSDRASATPTVRSTSVPQEVSNRSRLPAYGTEHATTPTGPWNAAARQCFWDAYEKGSPAEFVTTSPTTEGDPVTTIYRVLAAGRIQVFVDATRDRWGSGTWLRLDCKSLAPAVTPTIPPDFGPDESCVEATIG